jgi:hypothetical protein
MLPQFPGPGEMLRMLGCFGLVCASLGGGIVWLLT